MEQAIFSCIESRIKDNTSYYSRFYVGSFSRDQAITYSNTLRRLLLSDSNNINISAVSILNAKHEYSLIQGVKESILDILLNLKQLVIVGLNYDNLILPYFAYLRAIGPVIVKSEDIIFPYVLKCFNKNQYIATLSDDGQLVMKIQLVNKSSNLIYSHLNLRFNSLLAYHTLYLVKNTEFPLILDSNFSCVNKVSYKINSSDELEDYSNHILLEIWTNGALSPRLILQKSTKKFIKMFASFYSIYSDCKFLDVSNEFFESYLINLSNKALFLKKSFFNQHADINYHNALFVNSYKNKSSNLDELNISLQSKFLLKKNGILTIGDLFQLKTNDLLEFYNFSLKSLKDIEESLSLYNFYYKD